MIKLDAEKYKKSGFEQAYFEQVYAQLRRKTHPTTNGTKKPRVIREIVWYLKEYKLLGFLGIKIDTAATVDSLSDAELEEIMRALILADAGTLRAMYLDLRLNNIKADDFTKYFGESAYEGMRKLVLNVPAVSEQPEKIPLLMAKSLKIRTCPYCNRIFIGSSDHEILGVQLDHFYSKSEYPLFAVCLYNLIPCCSFCNWKKLDDDNKSLISPFETELSFARALNFVLVRDPETEKEKVQLKVRERDPELKERYEANKEEFHLESAYDFHFTEAKQFYDKMQAYPPSLLHEIAAHMNAGKGEDEQKITAEALEMGLFREYFSEPEDYSRKPLAKFYRDLYYHYRGWK